MLLVLRFCDSLDLASYLCQLRFLANMLLLKVMVAGAGVSVGYVVVEGPVKESEDVVEVTYSHQ